MHLSDNEVEGLRNLAWMVYSYVEIQKLTRVPVRTAMRAVKGETYASAPGRTCPFVVCDWRHPRRKLSMVEAETIRARATAESQRSLALEYGVSRDVIRKIIKWETYNE